GWGVGVLESAGDVVVNATVIGTARQVQQSYVRMKRIAGAYQQGGARTAAGQYVAEWKDASIQLLKSLPVVNTVRQGIGIPAAYEQGSFEGGRQVGRTTFSLAGDVALVYGGVKSVQAMRAARGTPTGGPASAAPTTSDLAR